MGRVVGMPVMYQRKEKLHALDQSESSMVLVLGGYAGSRRKRIKRLFSNLVQDFIVFERDSDSPFKHFQTFSANLSCGRTSDI